MEKIDFLKVWFNVYRPNENGDGTGPQEDFVGTMKIGDPLPKEMKDGDQVDLQILFYKENDQKRYFRECIRLTPETIKIYREATDK